MKRLLSSGGALLSGGFFKSPFHYFRLWNRPYVWVLYFLGVALAQIGPLCATGETGFPAGSLGEGAYSEMQAIFEDGIWFIKVDVLDVKIRFGPETTDQIQRLVMRAREIADVEQEIAECAIRSDNAWIQIKFLRDLSLDRFLKEVEKSIRKVRKAGLISQEDYSYIAEGLPRWYRPLEERGIREGDEMAYRIQGDQMRTRFQGRDGEVYVDHVDNGKRFCTAVLGGYLVEGSPFREALLGSLPEPEQGESR